MFCFFNIKYKYDCFYEHIFFITLNISEYFDLKIIKIVNDLN